MDAGDRYRKGIPFGGAVLLLAAVLFSAAAGSAVETVEVRRVADTSVLGEVVSYDVTPSGAVLVLTGDNIWDAGSGTFLFGAPLQRPAWVSEAGGRLLFLADGALFAIEGRAPKKLLDVPLRSPLALSDGQRTFLAGITPEGRSVLFLYKEGIGHKPLLELDAPVDAMAFRRGALLFTAGSRIFALREGGKAAVLAELPGFPFLPSLAVDDRDGTVYFSDGESTYAMRGDGFVVVRRGMGGILRFREGSLYLLSPREKAIFRFSGLPEAISSPGSLSPLADPCRAPVVSLYCEAENLRAHLKAVSEVERVRGPGAVAELAPYKEEQRKALRKVSSALEKESASGVQAVLWSGGNEPKAVGRNSSVSGGRRGAALLLWDGTGVKVGPDSKAVLDGCDTTRECRLTLEKGLLYVETPIFRGEGAESPRAARHTVEAGAVTLRFESTRVALFSSGDAAAVAVLEGRVRASSSRGGSVILAAGETIEARRGEPLGAPRAADMERLNRWWEEIR